MQEAAYSASAAAGYDMQRLFAMNRIWLVRETDITYYEPLVYGDTVVVKTYVQDFRRVRSRRAYELRKAVSGAMVATATTDWVFLDRETHRPATIPDEITQAFFPKVCRRRETPRPFSGAAGPAGRFHHATHGRMARSRSGTTRKQQQLSGVSGRGRGTCCRCPRLADVALACRKHGRRRPQLSHRLRAASVVWRRVGGGDLGIGYEAIYSIAPLHHSPHRRWCADGTGAGFVGLCFSTAVNHGGFLLIFSADFAPNIVT